MKKIQVSCHAIPLLSLLSLSVLITFYAAFSSPMDGDNIHQVWTYTDNIRRIIDIKRFNDASIYFPLKGASGLQEYQPINTLLYIPFYFAKQPELGLYFILFFTLFSSAVSIYSLSCLLGATSFFATLAALYSLTSNYILIQLVHVQLLSIYLIISPIIFALLYFRNQKKLLLILIAIVSFFCSVGPSYNGILSHFLFFSFYIWQSWRTKKWRLCLNIIIFQTIGGVLALPFWLPYFWVAAYGISRGVKEIRSYSIPLEFIFAKSNAVECIYPGVVLLMVAFWPFIHFFVRVASKATNKIQTNGLLFFIVFGLIFILGSTGPNFICGNISWCFNPFFYFFYSIIPIFKALRFIAHVGYVGMMLLVVSGAVILSHDFIKIQNYRLGKFFTTVVAMAALLGILIQNLNIAVIKSQSIFANVTFQNIVHFPRATKAYAITSQIHDAKVLVLPWSNNYSFQFSQLYKATVVSRLPTFTGKTGYQPLLFELMATLSKDFPSMAFAQFMQTLGLNTVIYTDVRSCATMRSPYFERVYAGCDGCVFRLVTERLADAPSDVLVINFSNAGNLWRFLPDWNYVWSLPKSGFSVPDQNGAPMHRPRVRLALPLPPGTAQRGSLTMRIYLYTQHPASEGPLEFHAHLNGYDLGAFPLHDGDPQYVDVPLPEQAIRADQENDFAITVDERHMARVVWHYVVVGGREAVASPGQARSVLTRGTALDFSTSGMGFPYLGHGWSYGESWGRWSDGNQAELLLPLADESGEGVDVVVKLRFLPSLVREGRKIAVRADGRPVAVIEADPHDTEYHFHIKPEKPLTTITFDLGDIPPAETLGIKDEKRRLGLGLLGVFLCRDCRTIHSTNSVMTPGDIFRFSTGGRGNVFVGSGWDGPEPFGRWSIGEQADLKLQVDPGDGREAWIKGRYTVVLCANKSIPILVNGEKRAVLLPLPGEQDVEFPIMPAERQKGKIDVQFDIGKIASPAEAGIGKDSRHLGVGLISMKLVEEDCR